MTTESMMASLAGAAEGETAEADPQLEHDAEVEQEVEAEAPAAPAEPAKPTQEQIASNLQAALRESRAEQKAMREELAQLRAKLNEQTKPPAEAAKDPDFLEDPKGYVDAKEKKLMEELNKEREENKKTKDQQQQEQERQQLLSQTITHEQQFVATTPDYPQALEHIRSTRAAQLRVIHPDATPEQIAGQIAHEEMTFAKQIIAAGKNPAEFAYNYAKAMGYKGAKAPPKTNGAGSRAEARTLGSSGGTDDDGEPNYRGARDGISEFSAAKGERFKKRG